MDWISPLILKKVMNKIIKKNAIYVSVLVLALGIVPSHVFIYAEETCYVEDGADSEGDGSKDKPYDEISGALRNNCKSIKLLNGSYKESFTLKKSVEIAGSNTDKVIIKGKITLEDDSEISKLTVDAGGIIVTSGASVNIKDVKIKNSIRTGIETLGGGKLKIKDSSITAGRKGMYIQKKTKIEIIGCKVYKNSEEGIDIRANVSGNIIGNEIYENGESGIELILGEADLTISENEIENNSSSGIAFQYYNDFDDFGNVEVRKNSIKKNDNYGIDCKAPSGGKGKPKGYWSESVTLSSNEISNNEKKEFSSSCKFDEGEKTDASKSDKEKDAEIENIESGDVDEENLVMEEKERLERLKKEKEEREQEIQREREAKKYINNLYGELDNLYREDESVKKVIESRHSFWSFVVGPNYKSVKHVLDHSPIYEEKIKLIEEKTIEIKNKEIIDDIYTELNVVKARKEEIISFAGKQKEKFSIFGWVFKKIHLK